jgi:hypothetical protein
MINATHIYRDRENEGTSLEETLWIIKKWICSI